MTPGARVWTLGRHLITLIQLKNRQLLFLFWPFICVKAPNAMLTLILVTTRSLSQNV